MVKVKKAQEGGPVNRSAAAKEADMKAKRRLSAESPVRHDGQGFHHVRTMVATGQSVYLARDVGVFLGFGARGGNLSRNFRHAWKGHFSEGVDYIADDRHRIWLTEGALIRTMEMVANGTHETRAAIATGLLGAWPQQRSRADDRPKNAEPAPAKKSAIDLLRLKWKDKGKAGGVASVGKTVAAKFPNLIKGAQKRGPR